MRPVPNATRFAHLSAVFALLFAGAAACNDAPAPGPRDGRDLPAVDTGRVAVGDTAPDFTLLDRTGAPVTLSELRGRRIVLAFYRGHWWPYCAHQLGELKDLLSDDQRESTRIVAVSVDDAEKIERMRERVATEHGSPPDFTFLSDPGHQVIDRYGILNPDDRRGIPHPTTFVLDRDGVVRWKFIETDYKVRPTNGMILEALAGLE